MATTARKAKASSADEEVARLQKRIEKAQAQARAIPIGSEKLKLNFVRDCETIASAAGHWLDDFKDRLAEGAWDSLRRDLSAMLTLVNALAAIELRTEAAS